ncbi:MAG: arsenic efflux protein [Albidovulum sp.]|nr:arsenic efflux protein [Albidovulum sp.]
MTFRSDFLFTSQPSGIVAGGPVNRIRFRRIAVGLLLLFLAAFPGELGELTRNLAIDAYLQVSVFVAATLFAIYGSEKLFRFDLGRFMRNATKFEVPIAALLGALPGCGGAVAVVAAYTAGNVRFGSLVAALTATMGDAAFVLIAVRPDAAAIVLPLSLGVGIVTGFVINALFDRRSTKAASQKFQAAERIGGPRARDMAFLAVAAPGLLFGILQLLQVEIAGPLAALPTVIGLAGVAMAVAAWAASPIDAMTNKDDPPSTRTCEETSFITIWVICAFLAYDYSVEFLGLDFEAAFGLIAPFVPLVAVLAGFIPGCGPQILVTALYISGTIPFAAIIGNAISNDGDALFPAIALNPRAAISATLVSAIPALIVAYGFFFLAPGFMN